MPESHQHFGKCSLHVWVDNYQNAVLCNANRLQELRDFKSLARFISLCRTHSADDNLSLFFFLKKSPCLFKRRKKQKKMQEENDYEAYSIYIIEIQLQISHSNKSVRIGLVNQVWNGENGLLKGAISSELERNITNV